VPQPYSRTDLRRLRASLDARWPKLPQEEAEKWLPRFQEGRSPYSRVRTHVVRTQLDAVISLALQLALRRCEICQLTVDDTHPDNVGVLLRPNSDSWDGARMVPWTSPCHYRVAEWIDCRSYLRSETDQLWLSLHAGPTCGELMTSHTFSRLLTTYVGPEWTFSRLRATGAVAWSKAGLPVERLRELLGLARIEDVLRYAQLGVTGTLERDIARLNGPFLHLVEPGQGWSNRPRELEVLA
jgi:integrase